MTRNTSKSSRIFISLFAISWIALAGAVGFLFFENRDLNDQINLTNAEKNERLVAEINEVFDLPDNEDPVVGIVTDVEEFKIEFPAFANDDVQLDDRLLFYRKNRLNVLYRPSEKRVVKTYNVSVPIAVELIGTQEAIDQTQPLLGAFGNSVSVTTRVDNNITQAFVFDVDGDQTSDAQSIADQLGLEVGSTLPSNIIPDSVTEIVIAVVVTSEPAAATPPPAAEGN